METSANARSNWDVASHGSIAPSRPVIVSRSSTATNLFVQPIQSLRITAKPSEVARSQNIEPNLAIACVRPMKPTSGSNVWVPTASFPSRASRPSKKEVSELIAIFVTLLRKR